MQILKFGVINVIKLAPVIFDYFSSFPKLGDNIFFFLENFYKSLYPTLATLFQSSLTYHVFSFSIFSGNYVFLLKLL